MRQDYRDGNAYITGFTESRGFPNTDGSTWAGGRDAFTVVVDPDGGLLHAGTLGCFQDEGGAGIDFLRVEDTAFVLTGGSTNSSNFPATSDAFQSERAGDSDGWVDVLQLDTTVGPTFAVDNRSTSLLGGNGTDFVDSLGFSKFSINVGFRFDENAVFVAMTTDSDNMAEFGVPHPTRAGGTDGHVTVLRLDPAFAPAWPSAEDEVAFATYLPGGTGDESEVFFEISESSLGGPRNKDKVYFFYSAKSDDVPTSEGVVMEDYPSGPQSLVVSVMEFNPETGTAEFRTTYAGGNNFDQASRMALDPNGAPAVVGLTFSQIPTTPDAAFSNLNGVFGGYLTMFSPDFTELYYSTYMWGNRNSNVTDVTFDPFSQIYIIGINGLGALTTPGAFQNNFGGLPWDATGAKISRILLPENGLVSAAKYEQAPGGGVAPQEMVVQFGTNVGPDELVGLEIGSDGMVTNSLGETSVLVDGERAPMIYASEFQSSYVFRFSVGFRFLRVAQEEELFATVQFEVDGDLSNTLRVPIVESNPGIFALNATGQGQGAILNPDFSVNGPNNPAPSDGFIVVYGTGGGLVDPPCPDAGFGPSQEPFPRLQLPQRAFIGGVEAQVLYGGSAPFLVCGVNQWNLAPTNQPSGPAVPIQICSGENCSQEGITAAFQ